MVKMFLQSEDDKKREERENFLITTIPITIQAGHEPSLYHTGEEHEEGKFFIGITLFLINISK